MDRFWSTHSQNRHYR